MHHASAIANQPETLTLPLAGRSRHGVRRIEALLAVMASPGHGSAGRFGFRRSPWAGGSIVQMGKSAPLLRLLLLPAIVAAVWILTATAGHLLMTPASLRLHPVASSMAALGFPNALPDHLRHLLECPGFAVVTVLAALAAAAFAAVLLPAAGKGAGSRGTAFLAAWACVVVASVAGSAVLAGGLVLAEWPPARKIYIFSSVTPLLLSGAYWGVIWGWIPALLAARSPGVQRTPPNPPAPPAPPAQPRRDAGSGRPWLRPLWAFAGASVALLLLTPVLATDPDVYAEPVTPEPTQEPVVYGAEPVGPSLTPPDPQWCTGEEVTADIDGWDAATGHRGARITVTNTGDRSCVVDNYPDLAFENTDGWVMDITAVHGGSFMTEDTPAGPVPLGPGDSASAGIGWNGTAGAGMTRVGTLLVAPFAGTLRQKLEADIDLTEPGFLTVTRWVPAEPLSYN